MILEFIEHLKTQVTPTVEYAYTADPLGDESLSDELPAIHVYPGNYSAEASGTDNVVRQSLQEEVICMLGCKIEDYESLRDELRNASLGWTLGSYDAFELAGGEPIGLKAGVIWIRESYTTRHIITES